NGAQTEYVAGPPDFAPSPSLFRRHEMGRTQHLAGDRQTRLSIEPFGQSKISDSRPVRRGVDEHVGRFEIAVKDALPMRVVNRFSTELHVAAGGSRWTR